MGESLMASDVPKAVFFCTAPFQVLAAAAASKGHAVSVLFVIDAPALRTMVGALSSSFSKVVWLRGKVRRVRAGAVRWALPLLRVFLDPDAHRAHLFVGSYSAPSEWLSKKLSPLSTTLLDDGAAMFAIADERRGGIQRRFGDGLCVRTLFPFLEFGPNDRVAALSLDGLRASVPVATAKTEAETIFIGSPLVEAGHLSIDGYLSCIERSVTAVGPLVYLAHPREKRVNIEKALGITGVLGEAIPGLPFETALLTGVLAPRRVVGASSTALFSARLLGFAREDVVAIVPGNGALLRDLTNWNRYYHHSEFVMTVLRIAGPLADTQDGDSIA